MGSAPGWVPSLLPEEEIGVGSIIDVDVPPQTGGVWFATNHSLLHLHLKGWDIWTRADDLPTPLSAIACGLEGTVYLGTENGEIYSWHRSQGHKLLKQVPNAGIGCLRFGYHRRSRQPLLVAGCGTPKAPTQDTLCVTLYGALLLPGVRQGQESAPAIAHSEPLPTGVKGNTTDITFNTAGTPHLLFRDNQYSDNPSFIFHRLRFKHRPNGELRLQWPAFSIIDTQCNTFEYMRIRFSSGLWVGTPGGLYHLNPSKHSTQLGILLNIPSTGPVYDIYQDSRNWLWVAGHEGLFLRAKRKWWRFIDPPGDILFKLSRIVENEVGDIYAARDDHYFWLKWSTHLGPSGVSTQTLKKLAEPVRNTAASHSL